MADVDGDGDGWGGGEMNGGEVRVWWVGFIYTAVFWMRVCMRILRI